MVIFMLEVSAGISIYAYRGKLLEGYGRGLNQSLATYSTDPEKKTDFDIMQSTVSTTNHHTSVAAKHVNWLERK